MITMLLGLAMTLTGPDLGTLLRVQDYPEWAVNKSSSAAALVRLLVDPTGKIVRCETVATEGNANLAAQICVVARHHKVHPAITADGSPAWSQAMTMARFYIPGAAEADRIAKLGQSPDAELTVNRLPGGAGMIDVKVVLAVDEQGVPTLCTTDPRSDVGGNPAALAAAVCANRATLGLKTVTAPDGHPLRYVTPLTVRLIAAR